MPALATWPFDSVLAPASSGPLLYRSFLLIVRHTSQRHNNSGESLSETTRFARRGVVRCGVCAEHTDWWARVSHAATVRFGITLKYGTIHSSAGMDATMWCTFPFRIFKE